MPGRLSGDSPCNLVLRRGRNWTAVGFFALLGGLHLAIAVAAFSRLRYDGFMSFVFGGIFLMIATASYFCTFEVAVLPSQKRIRLRLGFRRLHHDRYIPFSQVESVRLTMVGRANCLEVICRDEEIECPPTTVPREEALLLAMLMGVQLVKLIDDRGKTERVRSPLSHTPRAVD